MAPGDTEDEKQKKAYVENADFCLMDIPLKFNITVLYRRKNSFE